MIKAVIYFLGKHSKIIRISYHKWSGGKWLWGLIGYIKDNPDGLSIDGPTVIPEEDFNRLIDSLFKN